MKTNTTVLPSNAMDLKEGMRVLILKTENVLQRYPHFANSIGVIREVPVHPSTWFKVSFPPDHKCATFRPSALHPVDAEDKLIPGYVVKCSISRSARSNHGQMKATQQHARMKSMKTNTTESISSVHTFSARHADNTKKLLKKLATVGSVLGSTDPDTWEGKKVVVINGKFLGQTGEIKSAGNGWVQIDTPTGEIAKRASELGILNDDDISARQLAPEDHDVESDSSDSSLDAELVNEEVPKSKKRPRPDENIYARPYNVRHNQNVVDVVVDEEVVVQQRYNNGALPLQDSTFLKSRRDFIKNYVQNSRKKICNRPNLSEWKVKLNASLFSDQIAEIQAAKAFDETVCFGCGLERWPGAKFCWNQSCTSSPVYDPEKAIQAIQDKQYNLNMSGSQVAQLNPVTTHLLLRDGPIDLLSVYHAAATTHSVLQQPQEDSAVLISSMTKFAEAICSPATTLAAESPYIYETMVQQDADFVSFDTGDSMDSTNSSNSYDFTCRPYKPHCSTGEHQPVNTLSS